MSELLLRGWNVAVPVVDVGDDVFIIDDNDKTAFRMQVKTATATDTSSAEPRSGRTVQVAKFKLSRKQLSEVQAVELFYFFVARSSNRWRFLIISREQLQATPEVRVR